MTDDDCVTLWEDEELILSVYAGPFSSVKSDSVSESDDEIRPTSLSEDSASDSSGFFARTTQYRLTRGTELSSI